MSGRVEGKVAFITGAARGQGRSHAIRLAEEGADIIAVDVLEDISSAPIPMGTAEEMAETVRLVEALDRRIVAGKADVRDVGALQAVLDEGLALFGHLDIVCANAGICTVQPWDEVTPEIWRDTLDINVVGVWNTIAVAIPSLIANGGGSVIATSSTAGLKGTPFFGPYVASKHAVLGIARSLANELARHNIRVNTLHPGGVDTPMLLGLARLPALIAADPALGSSFQNASSSTKSEPRDISEAVLFLASDESRNVTGLEFKVDSGNTIR